MAANPIYKFLQTAALFLSAWMLAACGETEVPDGVSDAPTPQIIFLFSPGGLGDMSYNDCILAGLQQFKKSHPEVDVFLYSPPSMEAAERIFTDWLKRPGSDIPVVFTLASNDYEYMVDEFVEPHTLTDNKRLLLFESLKEYPDPRISTFQISMYGASYLAGVSARECAGDKRSLVLLGSSSDVPIQSARDGFIAGYDGEDYDIEYLADDWTGYVMANVTYQRMSEWGPAYGFIFPVAGGSNMGLYRYTREYEDSPYMAGMDIDQSGFSHKITGSVVKRLDLLIEEYFDGWLLTGDLPEPRIYGLESGYVDWMLSPRYEELLRRKTEAARPAAVRNENEYYETVSL